MTRRLRLVLLTVLTAALAAIGIVAPTAANAAVLSRGASLAHPYSDPMWYPLATPAQMGCYHSNCGGSDHSTYLWDIVGQRSSNTQAVYAMGAGVVHIGATNTGCGHAQSRGNYLYVDHGNGVLTYYGHLGRMLVRNGQYVTPRTALAYMGNSGYARCHTYPWLRYLMIALKRGGTNGHYAEIPQTYACNNSGARVLLPNQLPAGAASRWDRVRNQQSLPAMSSSRTCAAVPVATSGHPVHVGMAKHGKSTMYVHWLHASAANHVTRVAVVLSEYHPSIHRWLPLSSQWLGGGANATRFHHLQHKRHYRAYVQFHNAAGYSAQSYNAYASIGK